MAERGAYLVFRLETRNESALSGLRKHVRGGFNQTTLDLPDLHQLVHGTPGGAIPLRPSASKADMRKWRGEAKALRGGGRPPAPWCEAVLVGRKIIDWQPDEGRRWGEACVAEFERLMPHATIIEAQLHTREAEWHVHIVAQPRGIDARGKMRASKNAMIRSAIEVETGEPPPMAGVRGRKEHGEDASTLQTAFHRACGAPFGLIRGEVGSKAKHTEIDDTARVAATAREVEVLKQRREAELAEVIDFKAERAAVESTAAELDERTKTLLEARAKIVADGQRLDVRMAQFKEERAAAESKFREEVAAHNQAVKAAKAQHARDAKVIVNAKERLAASRTEIDGRKAELDSAEASLTRREAEFEKARLRAFSEHAKSVASVRQEAARLEGERDALNERIRSHEDAVAKQAEQEAAHEAAVAEHEAEVAAHKEVVERDLRDRAAAVQTYNAQAEALREKVAKFRKEREAVAAKLREARERTMSIRRAEAVLDFGLEGRFSAEVVKDALFGIREGLPIPPDVEDALDGVREAAQSKDQVRGGLRLVQGGVEGQGDEGGRDEPKA